MNENQRREVIKWVEEYMKFLCIENVENTSLLMQLETDFDISLVPTDFVYETNKNGSCTYLEYYNTFFKNKYGKENKAVRWKSIEDDDKNTLRKHTTENCIKILETYLLDSTKARETRDMIITLESCIIISLIFTYQDLFNIKMNSILDKLIEFNHSNESRRAVGVEIRDKLWNVLEHFDYNFSFIR